MSFDEILDLTADFFKLYDAGAVFLPVGHS